MSSTLNTLLGYAPLALICVTLLVGVILALVRWRQHPTVSLLAVLGCGLLLLAILGGLALDRLLWHVRDAQGWDMAQFGLRSRIVSWVRALVSTAGYALLFFATFGWRRRPAPLGPFEEPPRRPPEADRYGDVNRGSEDVRKPLPGDRP